MRNLIFIVILFSPALVHGQYYVEDYDPDYVPYNLQEAIENMNHISCNSVVKDYDATYENYLKWYGTPVSVGETLDVEYGGLKEYTEEKIRQCLVKVRDTKIEESTKDCDFSVIDILTKEQAQEFKDVINECEDLRAIDECDLEYIDKMSGSKKVIYNQEISKCRTPLEPEPEIIEPEKEIEDEISIEEQEDNTFLEQVEIPAIEPVTYTPPASVATPKPRPIEESAETKVEEDSVVPTEEEVIEVTEADLARIVEERVAAALEKNSQEEIVPEKPSFLKRVVNFLLGWL